MYDHGYMYPGPAIKGVHDGYGAAGKPGHDQAVSAGRNMRRMIADNPIEPPLDAKPLVAMFDKWDREIGAAKMKK